MCDRSQIDILAEYVVSEWTMLRLRSRDSLCEMTLAIAKRDDTDYDIIMRRVDERLGNPDNLSFRDAN